MRSLCVKAIFMAAITPLNAMASEEALEPQRPTIVVIGAASDRPQERQDSVRILRRADIDRRSVSSLRDLLQSESGLQFSEIPGGPQSVFIRGASSQQLLVLIDGVKVNDPTHVNRGFDFSQIDLMSIEQIEIIKGPQSVIWGPGAMAGVISITTRSGAAQMGEKQFSLRQEIGTFERLATGISGSAPLSESVQSTAHVSQSYSRGPTVASGQGDLDARSTGVQSGGLRYVPSFGGQAVISATRQLSSTDIDAGAFQDAENSRVDTDRLTTVARYETPDLFGFWKWEVAGTTHSIRRFYTTPLLQIDYEGGGEELTISNSAHAFGRMIKLWSGVEYGAERMRATSPSPATSLQKTALERRSAFALLEVNKSGWHPSVGYRYDDFSQGESAGSATVNLERKWEDGLRLGSGYGTAFRNPSLYEFYAPYFGNRDLKSEHSEKWDVSAGYSFGRGNDFGVTYFQTTYQNLIDFDSSASRYTSVSSATVKGVEALLRTALDADLDVSASVTWLETMSPQYPDGLPQRPAWKAALVANYQMRRSTLLSADFVYIDTRRDSSASTVRDSSKFVMSAGIRESIQRDAELALRIENLNASGVEDYRGYTPAPRRLVGQLKWEF